MRPFSDYPQHLAFDTIFALTVNNLDIFVWRIIWDIQDLYLQSNKYFNSIISLLVAYVLIFLVKCLQIQEIHESFTRKHLPQVATRPPFFSERTRTKLVILMISAANINHWRCLWIFTLEYTKHSERGIYTLACLAFLAVIGMRRLGSFISSPFQIPRDCYEAAYGVQPASANHYYYLSLKNELTFDLMPNNWQIFLSFLIEFITDICTIHSWRSFWLFLDLHLYAGQPEKSAWSSLIIGMSLYALVHFINKPVNRYLSNSNEDSFKANKALYERGSESSSSNETVTKLDSTNLINPSDKPGSSSSSFVKRLLLHLVFMLGFFGTVCTWRGVWELQLIYCYPKILDSKILNNSMLNAIYMPTFILILWKMDLLASLQSRSSCEDDYFMYKDNFILDSNNLDYYRTNKPELFEPIVTNEKTVYVAIKPEELDEGKTLNDVVLAVR